MTNLLNINYYAVAPELVLIGFAFLVMILDLLRKGRDKAVLGYVTAFGLLVSIPVSYFTNEPVSFSGMVAADSFSAFFNIVFCVAAFLTTLISMDYMKKAKADRGEYYYITLFAVIGMMLMASANDFVNLYAGLELMALSFYVLVAFKINDNKSVEGALKYFVLGALSSGILLYGISFLYGYAGSTNFAEIARAVNAGSSQNMFLILGVCLTVAGFAFKVALFPFHLWSPDAYEGAPTPVTALLSVGSKAAAFAVFLRFFAGSLAVLQPHWAMLIWVFSAATMLYGSVVGVSQKNIVRMLAYSSIAHAGIILIGLLVTNDKGSSGVLYYLLVYAFMNIGAFSVITLFVRNNGKGANICDYKGLASKRPWLAFFMALFMVSLAGIPPTGGFTAKFFILASAVNSRYYLLAGIAVVSTVISLFFYAKVIFYMYMKEADDASLFTASPGAALYNVVIVISAVATVLIGIFPSVFMDMAVQAVKPLLM